MRHLSDTLARLSALSRRGNGAGAGATPDRLSDLTDFGSNPGALRARLHLPENMAAAAALVVVLHGCTQSAAGYDHAAGWSQLADRHGFAVLFPEQQRANNPNLCFNWFEPGDATRDRGEALSISQMVETTIAAHGLDRKRVFVTGLSAGGAMAGVMLATYPELFAAGAIIAGLPFGCAKTIPEAFDRMRGHGTPDDKALQALLRGASKHTGPWPRLSVWQGSADRTVSASNAESVVAQWRAVHALPEAPSHSETIGRHTRQIWRGQDGSDLIESYTVAGMGHGTPLDTAELGHAAPYMLDVGLSSTRLIAEFWGLTVRKAAAAVHDAPARPAVAPSKISEEKEPPHRSEPLPPNHASGVRKIIEDALRSAGLMR